MPEKTVQGAAKSSIGNPAQQKAIGHGDGPAMILAGPGSGKTYVLTRRIYHLIKAHHITPQEILVITFTKAAAAEMQQRFLKLLDGEHAPVNFGTFHAVFYAILKETSYCRPGSILSESEKRKILTDIIKRNHYDIPLNREMAEVLLAQISRCKNHAGDLGKTGPGGDGPKEKFAAEAGFLPAGLDAGSFLKIYRDYTESLEILGKVDFDDMALCCERLFQEREDILAQYRKRWRYLLIDEFQDISPLQYRLVRLLAEPENNLFIVGDDDQSIYGFRGASPSLMKGFPADYPLAEIITLEKNYRSTPEIAEAAGKVISHNKNRFPKQIKAEKESGKAVLIREFATETEERKALLEALKQEQAAGNLDNCAVICRTAGTFPVLAEQLKQAGIPCRVKERVKSIFEHDMVSDFLAYLEFANTPRPKRSRGQFFRFMNRPLRYLKREAVNEKADFEYMLWYYREKPVMQEEIRRLRRDLEKLKTMPVFLAVHYIRKGMGYDVYLREQYGRGETDIGELADLIQESARDCRTWETWQEKIERRIEKERKEAEGKADERGAAILTMHASKGLEYEKVFLPDCNEGITPHRKALTEEETEEERRVFYVAMTRAKAELTMLCVVPEKKLHESSSYTRPMRPSRFLKEAGYSISSNSLLSKNSSKASEARSYSSSSSI